MRLADFPASTLEALALDELPQSVRLFIDRHLPSIDHIEILEELYAGGHAHTVQSIGRVLVLGDDAVSGVLDDLAAAGLAVRSGAQYQYRPAATHAADVDAVIHAYNARPAVVIRAVYSRPSPLSSFAFLFPRGEMNTRTDS